MRRPTLQLPHDLNPFLGVGIPTHTSVTHMRFVQEVPQKSGPRRNPGYTVGAFTSALTGVLCKYLAFFETSPGCRSPVFSSLGLHTLAFNTPFPIPVTESSGQFRVGAYRDFLAVTAIGSLYVKEEHVETSSTPPSPVISLSDFATRLRIS